MPPVGQSPEEVFAQFEGAAVAALEVIKEVSNPDSIVPKADRVQAAALAHRAFDLKQQETMQILTDLRDFRFADAAKDYAADDLPDAGRTADLLEAAGLAIGETKLTAERGLLPMARRQLELGQWRRAAVLYDAARRAGAYDTAIQAGIQQAMDRVLPNRVLAQTKVDRATEAWTSAWIKTQVLNAQVNLLTGRGEGAVQSSINVKLHEQAVAAAEGRPLRGDVELGLNFDHPTPDYTNLQLDSKLRGTEERHA
jgi:hypothetical protein